jgi:hypothetical protein
VPPQSALSRRAQGGASGKKRSADEAELPAAQEAAAQEAAQEVTQE